MLKLHSFRLGFILVLLNGIFMGTAAQLDVDSDGWTIINPSPDSRIIYVSSSEGTDTNDGLSELTPIASINKALSLARDGYPDHILFKRGDEWFTQYGLGSFKSGRSATEPMVVGYYGESGVRPRFNIERSFMATFNLERSHLAFIGLEWYAYKHDPNSPDFNSNEKVSVFDQLGYGDNYLIEDCVANYASLGAFSPADDNNKYINVKLRRVIAFNSYAPDSYTVHELRTRIQGIYIHRTEGVLVEDCLFDHNGWNEVVPGSGPNMFNHNIYMSGYNPDPSRILIRNNIFARGAAHGVQLRSGGTCDNNLFVRNAININVGYDYVEAGWTEMLQWVSDINNTSVSGNVFLETRLMDSTNIEYPRTAARIGIGNIAIPCRIQNNIIAHSLNRDGEAIAGYSDINTIGGNVEYADNIIYKFYIKRDSETSNPGWLDPERSLGSYHRHLRRQGTTTNFLMMARKRPLRVWWPDYSADVVRNYFIEGFSMGSDNTPPEAPASLATTGITDGSVHTGWLWAVDDQRTLGYNIYIDGVKHNTEIVRDTFYSAYQLEALTEYTMGVTAVDVSGNESSPTELQFTTLDQDNNPPGVPEGLVPVEITDHSFTMGWKPATDDREVWGYNVYIDDVLHSDNVIPDTLYTADGLSMGVTYSIRISSVDPGGNESEKSAELAIRVIDTQAPTSPVNVILSEMNSTGFKISWDASTDNVGVTGYNVYLNNIFVGSTDQLSYVVEGLQPGTKYRIGVAASDLDGNESRLSSPIEIVTSVKSPESFSDLTVYPNPATEYIRINTNLLPVQIEILNIYGNTVISIIPSGEDSRQLNISKLPEGIYIIRLTTVEGQIMSRFVKN